MSTLPGLVSKGEKSKSKFQSLDINNLYRESRGENLEKQQQKSTIAYKHGMQSLGKVPNARRAPANLPSLKSEHTGSDSSAPLVPSGGSGWGKQDTTSTGTTNTTSTTPTSTASSNTSGAVSSSVPSHLTPHQVAIALPVASNTIQVAKHQLPPPIGLIHTATNDTTKSWSAVMSGGDVAHPPLYQSPQFHHDFPSLSTGDGNVGGGGGQEQQQIHPPANIPQYAPNPSLRPQTEGSWMQGGFRPGDTAMTMYTAGLGPQNAPQQHAAQAGQSLPPQYRAVMPTFMCKGNPMMFGNTMPNAPSTPMHMNMRPHPPDNRFTPRIVDASEVQRPIINKEELNRMDEIDEDMGWSAHDNIDYNQKLVFNESDLKRDKLQEKSSTNDATKQQQQRADSDKMDLMKSSGESPGSWSSSVTKQRQSEDELLKRRLQHNKDMELNVQRAKQRKEEEEKRFQEVSKHSSMRKMPSDSDDGSVRSEPPGLHCVSPLQLDTSKQMLSDAQIPSAVDKDANVAARIGGDNKPTTDENNKYYAAGGNRQNSFRHLTQIEGKNYPRKPPSKLTEKDPQRDVVREHSGASVSSYTRNPTQLAPRFLKQRNNNAALNPPSAVVQHYGSATHPSFDNRWTASNQSRPNKVLHHANKSDELASDNSQLVSDAPQLDERNEQQPVAKDVAASPSPSSSSAKSNANLVEETNEFDDRHVDADAVRPSAEDWHIDRRPNKRQPDDSSKPYERPQRPDSRDSRTSRDSRHSRDLDSRERDRDRDHHHRHHSSEQRWHDAVYEQSYEHYRSSKPDVSRSDDRRQVPGPITKDRMEADSFRNDGRNLTQLKRGQITDKQVSDIKKRVESNIKDEFNSGGDKQQQYNEVAKDSADVSSLEKGMKKVNISSDETKPKYDKGQAIPYRNDSHSTTGQGDVATKGDYNRHGGGDYKDRDDRKYMNRNKSGGNGSYYQNKSTNWSGNTGGNDYHKTNWQKRSSNVVGRSVTPNSCGSATANTASVSSTAATMPAETKDFSKQQTIRKSDKDDKNKELIKNEKSGDSNMGGNTFKSSNEKMPESMRDGYVPRGEPSRHGRGGGGGLNFKSGRGGMGRRIAGYGPPPTKNPFSNLEDKDKKTAPDDRNSEQDGKVRSPGGSASSFDSSRKQQSPNPWSNVDGSKADDNKNAKVDNSNRRPTVKSKHDYGADMAYEYDSKGGYKSNAYSKSVPFNVQSQKRGSMPPRHMGGDKRTMMSGSPNVSRQNSNSALRSSSSSSLQSTTGSGGAKKGPAGENVPMSTTAAIGGDWSSHHPNTDSGTAQTVETTEGFHEVKGKKLVKDNSKQVLNKAGDDNKNVKVDKDAGVMKSDRKMKPDQQHSPQLCNIPSLMALPIPPPPVINKGGISQMDRSRQNKTMMAPPPPRGGGKQQPRDRIQRQHSQGDISGLGSAQYAKDSGFTSGNAWDKSNELETAAHVGLDSSKTDDSSHTNQCMDVNNDKKCGNSKPDTVAQNQPILDGSTAPVNTIIFENTSFKSAPGSRSVKVHLKDDASVHHSGSTVGSPPLSSNYNKPIGDLLNNNNRDKQQPDNLQIPLSFKEDNADIKLDFFDSEISNLTDDKSSSTSKSISISRSIQNITTVGHNTLSTAAALNFKIQSVKKMWETPADQQHSTNISHDETFGSSFASDSNNSASEHSSVFKSTAEVGGGGDECHEGYTPTLGTTGANNSTNVCKVKPTQQVTSSGGVSTVNVVDQTVFTSGALRHQHSGVVSAGAATAAALMGNPLSPPPLQTVLGAAASMGIGQPSQQYAAAAAAAAPNQHLSYQAGLGGGNQFGIPTAIPSPPTVMYNSTGQLQAASAVAASGLFAPYQMDQSGGVMGGQPRTAQYSQYANHYGMGQAGGAPYSAQSVYLQTAPQGHPPPQPPPQAAPAPQLQDLYQNLSNYRLSANSAPYGQSQQLNNPTTVLISSTSNTLMSATIKPSNQQMSAIGTKTGNVGQTYQPQPQQGQQMYMAYEPSLQGSYMSNTGMLQPGHGAPIQNNVVPAMPPSSSYYSGSAAGQGGYYQQQPASSMPSAQMAQHQSGYGLQGNMFGAPTQTHNTAATANLPNCNYLSSPMITATLNAQQQQQYRTAAAAALSSTQFVKSGAIGTNQSLIDQSCNRPQQLKSPIGQVLSSMFSTSVQSSSPKLRQNCKPAQPSPTPQHKYLYPTVGNQHLSGVNTPRYPTPIQRPVNFPQNTTGGCHQMNATNQKTRSITSNANSNNPPPVVQADKMDSARNDNSKVVSAKVNKNSSEISTKALHAMDETSPLND